MKIKNILSVIIILMATNYSYAQYSSDAFRFSQFKNSTTARFTAIGSDNTAVGGDISSIYGNPAGLGMFTMSDFSFTPSLNLRSNNIKFGGNSSNNESNNLDLNNVGAVFHTKTYKSNDLDKGLLSINFGVGYQKKNSYKNDFLFEANTNENGLGDYFAEAANNENRAPENLVSNVTRGAYNAYLLDNPNGQYIPITSKTALQQLNIMRSGRTSSVDFSSGLNFGNKFFIGAGIGLSSFRYSSIENVNEKGLSRFDNSDENYNVNYNRNFDTNGSGLDLKLGLILKPINELRIGFSFESPTWYSITDNYFEEFNDNFKNSNNVDQYPFEYSLNTPSKLNAGLAYFIGNKGFVTANLGFIDYSTIKFKSNESFLDNKNNTEIKQNYKSVINYSVGGEYKLSKEFMLRAGYQSTGNPYRNLMNKEYKINSVSGGLGYRFNNYYLDAALVNSNDKLLYRTYVLNEGNEPTADIVTRRNSISLTFGLRF